MLEEPKENDSIECHLQQSSVNGLTCRAAKQTGDGTTNEVSPTICFNCDVGKIFRNVGCDGAAPKIRIWPNHGMHRIESIFCGRRKRDTTFQYCQSCSLVTAETTKELVTEARGLFQSQGFYAAFKDIEKARESFRDGNYENAITRSISCLESVIKIIHEKMNASLPEKKQITDLWKSVRQILKFDEVDNTGATYQLLNGISGIISQFGCLRNSLSDAHGRGNLSQQASESIAELAINVASTFSTMLVRLYKRMNGGPV